MFWLHVISIGLGLLVLAGLVGCLFALLNFLDDESIP
jgi:hypothetical protein